MAAGCGDRGGWHPCYKHRNRDMMIIATPVAGICPTIIFACLQRYRHAPWELALRERCAAWWPAGYILRACRIPSRRSIRPYTIPALSPSAECRMATGAAGVVFYHHRLIHLAATTWAGAAMVCLHEMAHVWLWLHNSPWYDSERCANAIVRKWAYRCLSPREARAVGRVINAAERWESGQRHIRLPRPQAAPPLQRTTNSPACSPTAPPP